MINLLLKTLLAFHVLVRGLGNRLLPKQLTNPRIFSNTMLRKYGSAVGGAVINVSGWDDQDRQGGRYQDYFPNKTSYTISNAPTEGKGFGSVQDRSVQEIELNLLNPLPEYLHHAFDVVFNHTTLEHVFEPHIAMKNLCAMSRDTVILVVPVLQQIHHSPSYGDYWRPTTMAVAKLFLENGFEPLVIACNDQPFAPIYCFALAVRTPTKHADIVPSLEFNMGKYNYGSSLQEEATRGLLWPEKRQT